MIIGIAGSFGAGKGAVVDYLKKKGFTHYSASAFITEELTRLGMPVNRDSMIEVGNRLRKEHGPAYIIETLYDDAKKAGGDAVIESLRAVAEVRKLKELGAVVIGVDAAPEVRYERAVSRGSEKDKVSFEHWLTQERQESNPDDPTKQDIWGALKEADHLIENNGSIGDLHRTVDAFLAEMRHEG
ncbi:MAG TPA: AAA family ATPase [Candidatus Paceibacterota bacterium]|nr:AAA family ATPase [Candidatus Paceibacterota bacterium]